MNRNKTDPRVERTRRLLTEALVSLCVESSFDDLSVADIAKRAGVNRATFYLHFEGKRDLLERGLDGLFDSLADHFETRPAGMDEEAWARARMTAFFGLLEERRHFFSAMLSGAGAPMFMSRAAAFLERFMLEKRSDFMDGEGMPPELTARIVVSVLLGIAGFELSHPGALSPQAMADLYIRFMRGGLTAMGVPGSAHWGEAGTKGG